MHFVVLLIVLFVQNPIICQLIPFEEYRCGSGSMSTSFSYSASFSCDQVQLNHCCTLHDICYASCFLPQLSCDNQFCDCVSRIISNPFCQSLIFPAHCNLVRSFGKMFICPMMANDNNKTVPF